MVDFCLNLLKNNKAMLQWSCAFHVFFCSVLPVHLSFVFPLNNSNRGILRTRYIKNHWKTEYG
jgi:hypothetical protein